VPTVAVFLLPCCCFLAGCRAPGADFREAELRSKDREIRQLREQLAGRDGGRDRDHQAAYRPGGDGLHSVVVGRGTAGLDQDRKPGDEALRVLIEPRDRHGRAVKAAGTVHVAALEVGPGGQEAALCGWDIPAETLRGSWRYTVHGTGYQLVLPWKSWPNSSHLRIVVQFRQPDGRIHEDSRTIPVRLTAVKDRPPAPPAPVAARPLPPPPPLWQPTPPEVPDLSANVRLGRPELLNHPLFGP
jgi:hypothetical protein